MRRPPRLAVWFVVSTVAALGCGGGERRDSATAAAGAGAASGPSLIDACALLPYSDAEAIAGEPLRRMAAALDLPSGQDFAKCSYGNPAKLGVTVSLEVRRHPSPEQAADVQAASRGRLGTLAGEWQDVSLAGADQAFWADGRLDQLHVRRGAVRLIVTVTMGEEAGRRSAAAAVAASTLARLPTADGAGGTTP